MWNIFKTKRQKQLEASDFGRKNGWIVELNSKKIAALSEPQFADMFWYLYKIELIDDSLKEDIKDDFFWDKIDLKFYSISLDEYFIGEAIVNYKGATDELFIRGLQIIS